MRALLLLASVTLAAADSHETCGGTAHYRCGSRAAALAQCQTHGKRLCSKAEIHPKIGRVCAYMWASDSGDQGCFIGNGGSGCGRANTMHCAGSSYGGAHMFDAACCSNPPDPIPSCLTGSTATMPYKYSFSEGTYGNQISDGGSDMYDGGNRIWIRAGSTYSSQLSYTQQCGATPTWTSAGIADIQYYTCKATNTWVAYFKSASGAIDGFKTTGNLGADNYGTVVGGSLGVAGDGVHRAFWKRVQDGRQSTCGRQDTYMCIPSVNQLVIVPSSNWQSTHARNTNSGHHEVTEMSEGSGVAEMTYIMWAGTRAHIYSEAQYNTVYATAVQCLSPPTAAPVMPAYGGVSGDPFVQYQGKKTQVWLPLEKDISLMQCGDWELHGTAFGSGVAGDSQQWFKSLSLRAGADQLRVEAGTEQLQVEGVPQGLFNYTKKAETVTVTAAGMDMEFVYARVNKDAVGGRMHIDLKINKLDESTCDGALPEIWGLVPMSEATAAMLLPPKA